MNRWQKVVKTIAIVLAVFLAVSILSGLLNLASLAMYVISPDDYKNTEKNEDGYFELDAEESTNMEIELSSVSLSVKNGDSFRIYTNSDNIKFVQKTNGKIKITEKRPFTLFRVHSTDEHLIIELPEEFIFDTFCLQSGAGIIGIHTLAAKKLDLELGAGALSADKLFATEEADIDGGTGNITIKDGRLNKLDMDLGVGEVNLRAKLDNKCDIDFGVGNAKLLLLGEPEDYFIKTNKGVGSVTINDLPASKYSNPSKNGAPVYLDGGVGNITVDFE